MDAASLVDDRQARRVRLAFRIGVFVVAFVIHGADALGKYTPYRWLYADGSFYYNILKGLVQHGSLDQGHIHPRTWFNGTLGWNYNLTDDWSNISVGHDGTWYPKHGFLMPVFSIPFYLAFGPEGTLLFNVLCGALAALLCAELASRYTSRWIASLIGIGMAGMPAIVRQAYGYNNDVFYTWLVLATAIEVVDQRWSRAGFFGGLSVLAKVTNVLFLVPFGAWALAVTLHTPGTLLQKDWKPVIRIVGWSCVGIGIAALANWIMFGAPWTTPYQRVLIVHNGAQEIQSHFRLFSRDFNQGLGSIWTQLRQTLPAYLLGFVGCFALAYKRRFIPAVAFFLCLVLPLLFFAKYSWYREEFLDPSYALAAGPLGALCGLFFPPTVEAEIPVRTWKRGFAALALGLLLISLGRGALALADRTVTLSKLVPDSTVTQVFLGDIPCDYFNNQVGRWECSGFDRGQEWCFSGQTMDRFPTFAGTAKAPIDLNPNPSNQPRRMVFTPTWGSRLAFEYGIADGQGVDIPVDVTIKLDSVEIFHQSVVGAGWHELSIPTTPASKVPLEVDVTGQPTPARQFYFEGTIVP